MCGICGKLSNSGNGVSRDLLLRMCRTLKHRGPDDEVTWVISKPGFGSVGLGHTRLSIIDLSSAGRQPITNEDKSLRLVFNGEIYNYRRLREALKKNGHRFSSKTDSEVILHQYEEDGIRCLDKLNGMFAFALWDNRKNRLYLCRDRLGIKPLVYYWDGATLVFASEIKSILTDAGIKKEMDWTALGLYLNLSYVPSPRTIYKHIRKLQPGNYLIAENGSVTTHQYWDVAGCDSPHANVDSFSFQKKQLFDLVNTSVQRRLISDVPLGAFLSGGIDSSIVVGLMARNMDRPVKTFSIGYEDLPLYDETAYAKEVADFHGTDHHEFKLNYRDVLDIVPAVLDSLDEPFSDSSVFPTYIVSQKTRQEVTVALAGDGADELFAGYRKYMGEYWFQYYSRLPNVVKKSIVPILIHALPDSRNSRLTEKLRRAKKFLTGAHGRLEDRMLAWKEIFSPDACRKLLNPDIFVKASFGTAPNVIAGYLDRYAGDTVNKMLYLDVKDSLPDDMLNKVDRMSMQNALEVRVPFLDHEVVEFIFRIQGDKKLHRGKRKYILLEAFKDLLPETIQKRPKWGFEVPISAWLKKELRFLVNDYLSESCIKEQGIFDYRSVNDLIQRYLTGKSDTSWQIWNLIVFEYWHRKYF